ncbi:MAG: lipopolysaccharide biosynthesis protein [Terriglobia bacterium]
MKTLNLVATGLVSFLIMPFVIHALGDKMYGIWSLVAAFLGYYNLIEFGLSTAVGRFIAQGLGAGDEEKCNRFFNTALAMFSIMAVLVFLASIVVAAVTPLIVKNRADAAIFWKATLILGAALAAGFPLRVFKGVLEAHLRFDRTAGLDLLTLGLRTLLVIGSVLLGYKVLGLAWATLVSGIPALVLYPYFLKRDMPFMRIARAYWHKGSARELFSFGFYSFIAHLGGILRSQIGPFIVAPFLGLAAVTHFKIASVLADYYSEMVGAIIGVFQPVFARQEGAKDFEGLKRTLFFASKVSVGLAALILFGLVALGRPFIARWMGASYQDAYPCMVLLVVGYSFAVAQRPGVYVLYALARHGFLGVLVCIEGVSNVVISILCVKRYGLTGVAMGVLIPLAFTKLVIQPIYVCRVSSIPYFEYFRVIVSAIGKIALALIVPAIIVMKFAAPNYKILFILGSLSVILYVLPVGLTAFNRDENQLFLRTFLPRWAGRNN